MERGRWAGKWGEMDERMNESVVQTNERIEGKKDDG